MKAQTEHPTLFIPAAIDDYGLSPAQFRVLCAIARRGECFESAAGLAKRCRVKRNTLWRALGALLKMNAIKREARPGCTSIYLVRPVTEWQSPAGQREAPRSRPQPQTEPTPRPLLDTATRPKTDTTKGSPTKDIPLRYSQAQEGDPLFLEAWGKWMAYRCGLRNRPANIAAMFGEQLAWLGGFANDVAIEVINQSLRNGWQGLFPPKGGRRSARAGEEAHADHGKGF